MDARTRIDPETGKVEEGFRRRDKERQKERWRERRQREREAGKPPPIIEQAHSTLEELKRAIHHVRQTT